MRILKQARILVGLALFGAAGMCSAEVPATDSATGATTETIVVLGSAANTENCREVTQERARWIADKAFRDGAYQRAGDCYLAAGEQALADRAFVKAVPQANANASQRLAANLDVAKAQARQWKAAFRHR